MQEEDPYLEGLPLAQITRIVRDVIDLTHAVSGVLHYRIEEHRLRRGGEDADGDTTVVVLIHQTEEGQRLARPGTAAPHFPQRIAVHLAGERGPARAVWALCQSPLPCHRTGRLFPPEERRMLRAGDLNDFLLLHLCTAVSTLHTLQSFLETPESAAGAQGALGALAARVAAAVQEGLRIDLHLDADGLDSAHFVASSRGAGRAVPLHMDPSLQLLLPAAALSPRSAVRVGARFAVSPETQTTHTRLAPSPSVASAGLPPLKRTGARLRLARTGAQAPPLRTRVPSLDGAQDEPDEPDTEGAVEFKDRPEAYIEHSFMVSAEDRAGGDALVAVFHAQTRSAFTALAALLLPPVET